MDVSLATLDYEWAQLDAVDTGRTLAVIGTNLYGMPSDMPRLASFSRERRLFLVDDAAQALGASVGGRLSGTWGDVGIYSLDKGKNVSAMDGGLILSSNETVVRALEKEVAALPRPKSSDVLHALFKCGAYAAMLRPWLYWIPNAIPRLGLGQTMYDTSYAVEAYNRPLAALAVTMLRRLDAFTAARRANAAWLRANLSAVPGVALVEPHVKSEPVYLRFPILVADPRLRRELLDELNAAGIGATTSYPRSLAAIPQLAPYHADPALAPNGVAVADRILTLPTHPFVASTDLERMADVIHNAGNRHASLARPLEAIA